MTPLLRIACLGFSSGLPYFLLVSSTSIWLADLGFSYKVVGMLSWTSVPYTLKLVLSPWVEAWSWPYLTRRLGRRRSWALVMQVCLMSLIFILSFVPTYSLSLFFLICFAVGTAAALQDIVLEAYRIEVTPAPWQGMIASFSYFGFRLGMWASGYIALLLAHLFSWSLAFQCMSLFMSIGITTILLSPEPPTPTLSKPSARHLWDLLKKNILYFWTTYDMRWILTLILLFKAGDVFIRALWTPFLLDMGYHKGQIADVDKGLGMIAMFLGGSLGGMLTYRWGIRKALLCWVTLQSVASLLCLGHALEGPSLGWLMTTVSLNHLVGGIGGTAFITYLSSLCRPPDTGIQYAFVSSVGSFGRIGITCFAGLIADSFSWPVFFALATGIMVPLGWVASRLQPYQAQ